MGLRIRTNISSLNAQRRLGASTTKLNESMGKLASGSRINKSADDAAGLAVSENLKADIRSLKVARRNANDGVSLVQTAEGGLVETGNMLIRLRELAIQASSDTIGNQARQFLDKEFRQLKDEIDRIAHSTEFNGTRLLIGEGEVPEEVANHADAFPLEVHVGANYFEGADGLSESNPINILKVDFSKINSLTSGEGSLEIGRAEEGARVHDKASAQKSIATLDTAINQVSNHRSTLGSIQNRLGATIRNLDVQTENLESTRSRISDTDFASETAILTQANIMQQAGTSVLANANAQPQIALSLLNQ